MKEILEEDFDIIASDGLLIKGKSWIPTGGLKASFCIVHGIAEHCNRYTSLITFLNQKNIAVFSYDQRGHGRSEGKRGHISSYTLLLDDVENILKRARSEYPDLPIFLYGQSWGGNIVANYILKRSTREITGAILSAPWLRLMSTPAPFLLLLAFVANKIFPGFRQNNSLVPDTLSKDPEVVKNYMADPMVHPLISARNYIKSKEAGAWSLENAAKLSVPTLLIHGTGDEVTSWEASKEFARKAPECATLKLWENVKHEPHNDLEKDEVFNHLFQWIESKIPATFQTEKV